MEAAVYMAYAPEVHARHFVESRVVYIRAKPFATPRHRKRRRSQDVSLSVSMPLEKFRKPNGGIPAKPVTLQRRRQASDVVPPFGSVIDDAAVRHRRRGCGPRTRIPCSLTESCRRLSAASSPPPRSPALSGRLATVRKTGRPAQF